MVNGLVPIAVCRPPFRAQRRRWGRPVVHGGLALACLLALWAWPAAAVPTFQTSLDHDTVSLGESVTLSMTFNESAPSAPPSVPPIAGLRFGMTGASQQTTIVNSEVTFSSVYTLDLTPLRTGDFTIPALTATVNGLRLTSQPLKLRVVRGNPPQASGAPETAFVRLVSTTTNVYLGQVFPVEVHCYCLNNVGNIQVPQLGGDNFIIGSMPGNVRPSGSRQGNSIYNWFNFRVSASATRTGTLTLGPATWTLTELLGQRTFFGGWTGGQRPLTATSDTLPINVLPIPTNGAPPAFNGAIGNFTLAQYEAGPLSVGVGDPITLKIRIAGEGSFDTVTLPANEQGWREFKTYPPTGKLDTSDPLQIQGSKYLRAGHHSAQCRDQGDTPICLQLLRSLRRRLPHLDSSRHSPLRPRHSRHAAADDHRLRRHARGAGAEPGNRPHQTPARQGAGAAAAADPATCILDASGAAAAGLDLRPALAAPKGQAGQQPPTAPPPPGRAPGARGPGLVARPGRRQRVR